MSVPVNTLALALCTGLGLSSLFAINVVVGPTVLGEEPSYDDAPIRLALVSPGASLPPKARPVALVDAPGQALPTDIQARADMAGEADAPTAAAGVVGDADGNDIQLVAQADLAFGSEAGDDEATPEEDLFDGDGEADGNADEVANGGDPEGAGDLEVATTDVDVDIQSDDEIGIDDEVEAGDDIDDEAPLPVQVAVYFARERATLGPRSRRRLDRVAARLLSTGSLVIDVRGHTDDRGDSTYNYRLSERRARRVANYLLNRGVDGDQLEVVSLGATEPAVAGKSERAWRKNRRVELVWRNQ